MAKLVRCDGCDKTEVIVKEGTPPTIKGINILIQGSGKGEGHYDLCAHCIDQLVDQTDPTKWVRAAKRAPEVARA